MRHPRVTAIRAAGRPAHQLDATEALVGREGENVVEAQVGQDGADKTKLHGPSGENPKSEYRNPKQIQNLHQKTSNPTATVFPQFGF
jgi:hypothetical protein